MGEAWKFFILADALAESVLKAARVEGFERERDVSAGELSHIVCAHPLAATVPGYDLKIPLLDGDHVTDDTGTGFVHTAPGHGRDDFDIWMANQRDLTLRGIDTGIPSTVDADGFFTNEAPGFEGRRVIDDEGNKGDANEAVIKALIEAGNLVARGKLKHQYPHSWRSKKPVIFRNTPQWFIALDKPIGVFPKTLNLARSRRAGVPRRRHPSRRALRTLLRMRAHPGRHPLCARSHCARSPSRNGIRPLAKTASPA